MPTTILGNETYESALARRMAEEAAIDAAITQETAVMTKIVVTETMQQAGLKIASDTVNAKVAKHMNGLGGSITWEAWLEKDIPNRDLVVAYLEDRIDSVTAIFLAMHRAKEQP